MCKDKDHSSETPMAKEHMIQAWKDTKTSYEKMAKAAGVEVSDFDGLGPDAKMAWLHQTMIAGAFTEHDRKLNWLKSQVLGIAENLNGMLSILAAVQASLASATQSQPREAEGPRRDVN